MKTIALAALLTSCVCAQTQSFAGRKNAVIDAFAHPKGSGEPGYATIAARLYLHENAEWCSRRLQELLAQGPTFPVHPPLILLMLPTFLSQQ